MLNRSSQVISAGSIILVCEPAHVNAKTFEDACSLARASSDLVTVIGPIPNTVRDQLRLSRESADGAISFLSDTLDKRGNEPLLWFSHLDQYELTDDLLIVCIGNSADLNLYLSDRLRSEAKRVLKWQIVASTYARYALLDHKRTLSGFIPNDTRVWVRDLVDYFGRRCILQALEGVSSLRTLVIGETILDEYVYCNALGKVSKDPLVAFQVGDRTTQLGGVLAVARHISGLGSEVSVKSEIGQNQFEYIRAKLHDRISLDLTIKTQSDTIRKTRYVDRASNVKVFETYEMPIDDLQNDRRFFESSQILNEPDLVVVIDYGHGLIDATTIDALRKTPTTVVANAQSNAGNRGFNPISRYKGNPILFLNGSEVEVETRMKATNLITTVEDLARDLDTKEFFVTNGSGGLICWQQDQETITAPAFAPSVVDRTGAGDALLSCVALLRKAGIPREISAFYGNISGALLISTMGNELALSQDLVLEQAENIIEAVMEDK